MTDLTEAAAQWEAAGAHVAAERAGATALTLALAELEAIRVELPTLRMLLDSRQRGLGFLSVEAAKVQDDLLRQERRDRVEHARDGITVTGHTQAPGSINAFSLLAEWTALLVEIERFLTSRLDAAGVCVLATGPSRDDMDDTTRYIRVVRLLAVCRRGRWLTRLHSDLVQLHDRITRAIDGNQVKAMPDPCPWCGHRTLVADLLAGVIECGRDPDTGHYEPCICSDSYCPCRAPGRFRHTWMRDHKAHRGSSWHGLRDAINASQRTEDTP